MLDSKPNVPAEPQGGLKPEEFAQMDAGCGLFGDAENFQGTFENRRAVWPAWPFLEQQQIILVSQRQVRKRNFGRGCTKLRKLWKTNSFFKTRTVFTRKKLSSKVSRPRLSPGSHLVKSVLCMSIHIFHFEFGVFLLGL
jgi:hypothetical protein